MVLLGNKLDCNAIREVSFEVASAWARSYGIRPFEVTVINRDRLKEPFCYIAWRMANPGMSSHPIIALMCITCLGYMKYHAKASSPLQVHVVVDCHVWNAVMSWNHCNCIPLGATCCYHNYSLHCSIWLQGEAFQHFPY